MLSTSVHNGIHVRSPSGLAKLLCMIFTISGILCILLSTAPLTNIRGLIYMCVMSFACLSSALVYIKHICKIRSLQHHFCNAIKFELFLNTTLAAICFLASSAVLTLSLVTYSIAAFFGYVVFCLYALEAWSNYRRYRQRDMSTQT